MRNRAPCAPNGIFRASPLGVNTTISEVYSDNLKLSRKSTAFSVRAVQRRADLFEPLVEFVLVLRDGRMLVFPVRGESPFGDVLHALGADLHLDPYAVGPHHGRMQRLVAVGLGHRDPVAQPVGFRGVDVRDGGVYLPALGLFRGERQRLEHDADGKQVVYLLEGDLFALHLAPYRVDALHPPRDFVVRCCRGSSPAMIGALNLLMNSWRDASVSLSFCVISAYCCGNRYFMQRSSSSLLIE